YQLLTQVSGRAGRDKKKGRVIMQTYRPDNFVIQAAYKSDYEGFIEKEISIRETFEYPPFINLITVRVIADSRFKAINISKEFTSKLRKDLKKYLEVKIV